MHIDSLSWEDARNIVDEMASEGVSHVNESCSVITEAGHTPNSLLRLPYVVGVGASLTAGVVIALELMVSKL